MGQHQWRESLRGSNVHGKVSVPFPFLLGMCALKAQTLTCAPVYIVDSQPQETVGTIVDTMSW